MNDNQIQLNSTEFNGNQQMLIDINEYQLISIKFDRNQLILTNINRF